MLAIPDQLTAAVAAADIFAYDPAAPFNVQETGRETRGGAVVRDLTFTPAGSPVKAYLVSPASAPGPHAAILYIHWLGEPATTNHTEFYAAALPRKHLATYDAGHDLHTAEVAADRVAWLGRELGLK